MRLYCFLPFSSPFSHTIPIYIFPHKTLLAVKTEKRFDPSSISSFNPFNFLFPFISYYSFYPQIERNIHWYRFFHSGHDNAVMLWIERLDVKKIILSKRVQ